MPFSLFQERILGVPFPLLLTQDFLWYLRGSPGSLPPAVGPARPPGDPGGGPFFPNLAAKWNPECPHLSVASYRARSLLGYVPHQVWRGPEFPDFHRLRRQLILKSRAGIETSVFALVLPGPSLGHWPPGRHPLSGRHRNGAGPSSDLQPEQSLRPYSHRT